MASFFVHSIIASGKKERKKEKNIAVHIYREKKTVSRLLVKEGTLG